MLFRFIVVLGCIVLFINGCNSLISQNFGTHKLRTYTMEQVVRDNIGDSDFIEVTGVWQSGDYIHAPGGRTSKKPIVLYPLLDRAQLTALDSNQVVQPAIIAWTEDFSPDCVQQNNCIERKEITLKGIVREIPNEKDRSDQFSAARYKLPENVIFVEVDKAPIEWYWNLAMMVGAVVLAFLLERSSFRKTKSLNNNS
ncbi:MAG: hypothetical protein HUU01_24425 [Saprospiraceae bacterium]|nr:hypothetical protein [Saprospiraceae bacterium]